MTLEDLLVIELNNSYNLKFHVFTPGHEPFAILHWYPYVFDHPQPIEIQSNKGVTLVAMKKLARKEDYEEDKLYYGNLDDNLYLII